MIFIISPLVQSSDCRQLVYYANVSLHLESMARVVVRVWKCETTSVSHDKKPQAFSLCFSYCELKNWRRGRPWNKA